MNCQFEPGERLVRPPDAAAGRGDVERQLLWRAGRRDGHRRHAAARDVLRPVEEERIEHGRIGRLARTDELPGAGRMGAALSAAQPFRAARVASPGTSASG